MQVHLFLNQKQPLRRNNITVVEMNKSKIKFLNKYLSKSEMGTYSTAQASAPVQQYNLQFRMKQKFDQLYKRIQKISKNMNPDQIKGKIEKRFIVIPNQQITTDNKKAEVKHVTGLQQELIRLGYRSKAQKIPNQVQQDQTPIIKLEINNTAQKQQQLANIRVLGNTRYRHRLVSVMKPLKMSNNIKDYLSVEKIRLKDLEDSIVQKQQHNIVRNNRMRSSLYNQLGESFSNEIHRTALPTIAIEKPPEIKMNATTSKYMASKHKKFQPPFETYYHRDLIWRVAYSNQKILQFPAEYESKIKIFIGKGNNSRLVKSIITRRSWYQVTDRIEQANFIWTQIKVQSVFTSQPKVKYSHENDHFKKQNNHYVQRSIWSIYEQKAFKKYFDSYKHAESKMAENMRFRNKTMVKIWQKKHQSSQKKDTHQTKSVIDFSTCSMPAIGLTQQSSTISTASCSNIVNFPKTKIHNHLINSYLIGNKKALFQTMSDYYTKIGANVFDYLPLTFHISNGLEDDNYLKFLNVFYALAKKTDEEDRNSKFNAWIVKPGQNTNRGQGITVCLNLDAIKNILKKKDKHLDGSNKTYIVQKYIERPMLYKRRKFDLRHYMMINCSNGFVKGYWFKEGYVRTTSSQYTLKQGFGSVHLTNDAVQKNLPQYGKYQKGNKISYEQLDIYLSKINNKWSFWDQAYPKMKKIATDVIRASASSLDPERRTNFQIYGLDFMIDEQMQVFLIEVNTNPCLELSCPLLAKIIPKMVQSTLQICLDPLYPPPLNFSPKGTTFKKNCVEQIDYQLVYDDRFEETNVSDTRLLNDESLKKQEDDCYEDDGEDWNQD